MPKKLEKHLKATARHRGYSTERTNRYVYGTLSKLKKERRRKGR
jgi:hypothetical protein